MLSIKNLGMEQSIKFPMNFFRNNIYIYPSYGDSDNTIKDGLNNKLELIKKYRSSGTLDAAIA